MTRKDVRTSHEAVICDVCGRTLLRGELAEAYLAGGTRREVCELCTARAAHQGWIRESASLELADQGRTRPERRATLGRLLARRARPRPAVAGEPAAEDGGAPGIDPLEAYQPEHDIHAVPTNGELKAARALDLFNASEHPRTVAGVARSLGPPSVTVRPTAEASVVTVTVAWELCWYRYEVELAEGPGAVRVANQGYELDELAPDEQASNAAADEQGALALAG